MKIKLCGAVLLTMISCSLEHAFGDSYEKELQLQMQETADLWNKMNPAVLEEFGSAFRGFGYRTGAARSPESFTPAFAELLHRWFDTLEYYRLIPGETKIEIEGNIALVWGFHFEDFKHKGRPPEKVRVRTSATYRRDENGKWHELLAHRDIQKFRDGKYVPEYIE